MIHIDLHRSFKKKFKKLPVEVREQFYERIDSFREDQFHPLLNNHALRGKYLGSRSINITGDYRAISIDQGNTHFLFYDLDTHPKLYRS